MRTRLCFRMSLSDLHIRMSDIPVDQWMTVVIINPSEADIFVAWGKKYIMYDAYWHLENRKRIFKLTMPLDRFWEALRAVPFKDRSNIHQPIQMEFKRDEHYNLSIRSWKKLGDE